MRITKAVARAATRPLEAGGGWISGGSFVVREEHAQSPEGLSDLPAAQVSTIADIIDREIRGDLDTIEGTPHLYEFGKTIIRKCGSKTWVNRVLWDAFKGLYAWQSSELSPILFTETTEKPIFESDVIAVVIPMRPPADI